MTHTQEGKLFSFSLNWKIVKWVKRDAKQQEKEEEGKSLRVNRLISSAFDTVVHVLVIQKQLSLQLVRRRNERVKSSV